MDKKLTIAELTEGLAQRKGMTKKETDLFVRSVFEIVEQYLVSDRLVKIKGFGTFKLVAVSNRESVNVNSGERILIAGHSKVTFTPDKALADQVNKPFADFETTIINDNVSTEDMERIDTPEPEIAEESPEEAVVVDEIAADDATTPATGNVAANVADTIIEKTAPKEEPVTTAAEPIAESQPETVAEPEVKQEAETEAEAKEAEAEAKVEAETEEAADAESENTPEEEQEVEMPAATETHTEDATAAEPVQEISSSEIPEAIAHQESQPEPNVATQEDAKAIATSQPEAEPQVEPKADVHTASQAEPQVETKAEVRNSNLWKYVSVGIITVLLIIIAYMAGKNGAAPMPESQSEAVAEVAKVEPQVTDTMPAKKAESKKENESKKEKDVEQDLPQLEDGEYLIVGTDETYVVKRGDTMSKISKRKLRHTHLYKYIEIYNGISSRELEAGMEIKIPKLKKKEDKKSE